MSGKVAISLEEGLLADIERRRAETGESRSAFIRRAVQAQLARETEAEKDARYVQGYLEQPEDDGQVERARRSATETFSRIEWDEG